MRRRAAAATLLIALGALACSAAHQDTLRRYGRHLAQECTACHRGDGTDGAIPSLAGRPEAEIVALLADFRAGRKTNPVMLVTGIGFFVDAPVDFAFNDLTRTQFTFDTVAETPLPAALPLFGTGLGVIWLFGWRKRRRAATL